MFKIKNIKKALALAVLPFLLVGNLALAQPTRPSGGSPTNPGALCMDDADTWVLCDSTFTFGDTSSRIAEVWATLVNATTIVVSAFTTGDITISDVTPAIFFQDTDATAGDNNASVDVQCTDTGDGSEDCDVTFMQQVAGAAVNWLTVDADGAATFLITGAIEAGASNITTTGDITGGGIHVTGDTAAADGAALGYTAAEGLILTGQGSTSDITIKNDADATVISIPTGTTNVGINTTVPDHNLEVVGHVGITQTADGNDQHGMELVIDAAGFGDIKGFDIDYITGAIATGEDEAIILVNIDEISATGGEVYGLEVLATDGAADAIYGMKAGAVVAPILQDSGSFANPTTGTNNTTATDVADMIDGSAGTNTTIFVADNDYILIGAAAAFTEIEFIVETGVGNPGIQPTFGYSISGSHQFTNFSPVDGTNGFTNTGVVAWDAADLTSHTTNDDTGTFDIKITRTHNSKGSASLFYAKTAATVVYTWDKDGVVSANTLEVTGDTAAADKAAMGYTAVEGLILTGQGSTSDVTIKNDADATVLEILTGTTDITLPNLTASEIVITNASKGLVSAAVATYPSLTELAYVKGVTSAIQTQLGAKEGTLTNSAGLLAALNDETGTGLAVFNDTPTLITPALGTPGSGVMTNMTGLPVTGLANGTDGELITWSATGVAETVAVGTSTHVLTSNGAGVAPTFQAAGAGGDVLDDADLNFGTAPDSAIQFDTGQTEDSWMFQVDNTSRNMTIIEKADIGVDFGHAASTNPTLWIQSADGTTVGDSISLYHNQTDAVIATGGGNLNFLPNSTDYTAIGTGTANDGATDQNDLYVTDDIEFDGALKGGTLLQMAASSQINPGSDGHLRHSASYGTIILTNTTQTPDSPMLLAGANNRNWTLAEYADRGFDFAHANPTNPTFNVHSANSSTAEYISLTHDQTNAVIATGAGTININDTLQLGTAGATTGIMTLNGSTSGTITLQSAAAAGTYTLTMPVDDGTANQFLQTDGNGVLIWAAPGAATTSAAGIVELAIGSEVDTGTDATRAVTPDALAGSNLGVKTLGIVVTESDTATTTGDGTVGMPVPAAMNGMNVIDVLCTVHDKGITDLLTITILRRQAGVSTDVLSTGITMGDEFFASDGTIDTGEDDLNTGDILYVNVDTIHSGTAANGLSCIISGQLP